MCLSDEIHEYSKDLRDTSDWRYKWLEREIKNEKTDLEEPDSWGTTPLERASSYGLLNVVELLLENGAVLDKENREGKTPLFKASEEGHPEVVKMLLEKGADPNKADKEEMTPLVVARAKGHKEVVAILENAGALANYTLISASVEGNVEEVKKLLEVPTNDTNRVDNRHKWTPLVHASRRGHLEVVKLLLDVPGIVVNKSNKDGDTPLYYASIFGYAEIVKLLISKGADVNETNKRGDTPLYGACNRGRPEVVKLLIEAGAKNDEKNETFRSAVRYDYADIAKMLLENVSGIDVNQEDRDEQIPLHWALEKEHWDVVKLLLEKGADPNKVNKYGQTPFYLACEQGQMEIAKLLLENGADVDKTDKAGQTPLLVVSSPENERGMEMLKLLLENGADVDKENRDGYTPLQRSAKKGLVEVVKLLLEKGADIDKADEDGYTPLHKAAGSDQMEMVEFLLEKGADPSKKDNEGNTPRQHAAIRGHSDIVRVLTKEKKEQAIHSAALNDDLEAMKLLLEKGADVNQVNEYGLTPLIFATAPDVSEEMVKLLLEKGADPNKGDYKGRTSLHWAVEQNHMDNKIKLLLEAGADPNKANNDGVTPMFMVMEWARNKELAFVLLDYGANPEPKDKEGRGPVLKRSPPISEFDQIKKVFSDLRQEFETKLREACDARGWDLNYNSKKNVIKKINGHDGRFLTSDFDCVSIPLTFCGESGNESWRVVLDHGFVEKEQGPIGRWCDDTNYSVDIVVHGKVVKETDMDMEFMDEDKYHFCFNGDYNYWERRDPSHEMGDWEFEMVEEDRQAIPRSCWDEIKEEFRERFLD